MTTTNANGVPAAKGKKTTVRMPGRKEIELKGRHVAEFAALLERQRDEKLALIAKRLGMVETLVEQKSDRLDFHELSVNSLRDMLLAAYEQGVLDAFKNTYPCHENAVRLQKEGK